MDLQTLFRHCVKFVQFSAAMFVFLRQIFVDCRRIFGCVFCGIHFLKLEPLAFLLTCCALLVSKALVAHRSKKYFFFLLLTSVLERKTSYNNFFADVKNPFVLAYSDVKHRVERHILIYIYNVCTGKREIRNILNILR